MLKSLLILSILPIFFISTYAVSSFQGEDCDKYEDGRMLQKVCDDLNNLNQQLISQGETINDLTVRINELTILHYPDNETVPITPPVPEIVPLPEFPTPGPNPELAPPTPPIKYVYYSNGGFSFEWELIPDEPVDPRIPVTPITYTSEYSTDGINWIILDITESDESVFGGATNYVEYLLKVKATNEFGDSPYSLIWSAIPTEFGDNTQPPNYFMFDDYLSIGWNQADTFTHEPLMWILEKSTNYEEFEVISEILIINEKQQPNNYEDYNVINGNIYSYRVTMVTDFETQTRSGFSSILIP